MLFPARAGKLSCPYGVAAATALLGRAASAASRRREPLCGATGVYEIKGAPRKIRDFAGNQNPAKRFFDSLSSPRLCRGEFFIL